MAIGWRLGYNTVRDAILAIVPGLIPDQVLWTGSGEFGGLNTTGTADPSWTVLDNIGVLDAGAQKYPLPACSIKRLLVSAQNNTLNNPMTVTLLKNGVATGLTVAVPAGTNGVQSAVTTVNFADEDTYDVIQMAPGGTTGVVQFSVSLIGRVTP